MRSLINARAAVSAVWQSGQGMNHNGLHSKATVWMRKGKKKKKWHVSALFASFTVVFGCQVKATSNQNKYHCNYLCLGGSYLCLYSLMDSGLIQLIT